MTLCADGTLYIGEVSALSWRNGYRNGYRQLAALLGRQWSAATTTAATATPAPMKPEIVVALPHRRCVAADCSCTCAAEAVRAACMYSVVFPPKRSAIRPDSKSPSIWSGVLSLAEYWPTVHLFTARAAGVLSLRLAATWGGLVRGEVNGPSPSRPDFEITSAQTLAAMRIAPLGQKRHGSLPFRAALDANLDIEQPWFVD